jgi:hypothetical protein
MACKIASGILFTGLGAVNHYRSYTLWNHYAAKEKIFNAIMVTFVYGLGLASFYAGYEIYLGKTM